MGEERKEQSVSVVDEIRKRLKEAPEAGAGMPEELLLVPKDGTRLVRFLSDFNQAVSVKMHNKWQVFMPQPCLRYYDEACPFHVDGVKTVTVYHWTVYDYETSSKRMIGWKASLNSPIDDLLYLFDTNGTIKDRDVKLIRSGTGTKSGWRARALDPKEFTGKLSVAYTDDEVFKVLQKMIRYKTLEDAEKGAAERLATGS